MHRPVGPDARRLFVLEFVVDCLDRTGVAPQRICFEVTENAVISNIEYARRFIGVLHGMGCQFALDDFGRGLSSLSNLENLSLDYLKIDGSFIRNLASDNVNQAMVTAMIKLARSLNFQVIAEQVEDLSALDSVRRMGVDFVQATRSAAQCHCRSPVEIRVFTDDADRVPAR